MVKSNNIINLLLKKLKYAFDVVTSLKISHIIPSSIFLKIKYKLILHKKLNLMNPRCFNEKIQWLKIHDRQIIYTSYVDKIEVKRIIGRIIGKEYLIPTLGIWNGVEEINFDKLPNAFVLKCTHDSGGLTICKDKKSLDKEKIEKKIGKTLKINYFWYGREWPYKNVAPRIIAEQYMEDESGELVDYKVHNFNGEPKIILVCKNRYKESGLTEDFFDTEWNHLDIRRPDHPNSVEVIRKPEQLEEILELSKKLSKDIPFVRTDFYIVNGKVYFGEMTFYPASGFAPFIPEEWDYKFGEWLTLPGKR